MVDQSEVVDALNRKDNTYTKSEDFYATYTGPGTIPGSVNLTILDEEISNVPTLAHVEGQYMGTIVYESSGTFSKAEYPGLGKVVVEVLAGGGGGGSAGSTDSTWAGAAAGGGGGGYTRILITADNLLSSETVTVGSGGSGATGDGQTGSDGQASSFGSHCSANPGAGGEGDGSGSGVFISVGGAGGDGGNGDISIVGGDGFCGYRGGGDVFAGGAGGDSFYSGITRGNGSTGGGNGITGARYGGGGSGGHNRPNSGSNRSGGNGADGLVLIHLYSGFSQGCQVLCRRNKLMPLTVVGILKGVTVS